MTNCNYEPILVWQMFSSIPLNTLLPIMLENHLKIRSHITLQFKHVLLKQDQFEFGQFNVFDAT